MFSCGNEEFTVTIVFTLTIIYNNLRKNAIAIMTKRKIRIINTIKICHDFLTASPKS